MTTDPNAFLMGSGGKPATFKKHGDTCVGFITHLEVRQQTDFDTGELMVWDDGKPRMQLVATLQTEERDDDDDDGLRKVYIKGQMQKAVADAVRKCGARGLGEGGKLAVRYVATGEPKKKGANGAKQYAAKYEKPVYMPASNEAGDDVPAFGDDEPF